MVTSTCGLGRLAMQDGLSQLWNEAQERTLTFVPNSILGVAETVSRVKMNAKVRALDTVCATLTLFYVLQRTKTP